jgi:hypothetical protein
MPRLQRQESAVVLTKSILRAANVPIIGGHHVLALQVRRKDDKQHRYRSVVQNTRVAGRRVVQRPCCTWVRSKTRKSWRGGASIEVLEEGATQPRTRSLFVKNRCAGVLAGASIVHVKLSQLQLRRPRQWDACWLALLMWRELQLDPFWPKRWA